VNPLPRKPRQEKAAPPRPVPAEEPAATPFDSRILIGVLLWLALFLIIFFSFKLPNSPFTRLDVWGRVPWDLLDLIDPPEPQPAEVSSWGNLSQRIPPLTVAALILTAAWATGQLLLRVIRPELGGQGSEQTFFAFALGLSAWSLLTLICGCFGFLSRLFFGGVMLAAIAGEVGLRLANRGGQQNRGDDSAPHWRDYNLWLMLTLPFVLCMLLGALLPSTDFDVLEYHFQGPKEFYQAGRITMLPHNVYTSFPFATEMLTLLSMTLLGDWYWGAVAGKVVLMSFGPLTAVGLYAAGARWFTPRAGIYAAAIHLTTPWIYRISTIAYTEGGLAFYLFAALYAVMIGVERFRAAENQPLPVWTFLLAGLLAGTAMACKYPGLLSVVIPLGLAAVILPLLPDKDRSANVAAALKFGVAFGLGTLITIGPWLLKNSVETGNPVYPLAYSIFGGADWNDQLNAKWKNGHSPKTHSPFDLAEKFKDVTVKSDWLSPFLFGIAPLAFLLKDKRRIVVWLWVFVGYLFLTWWIFTHRIDRFWVPLIPVVSLLAGAGATWSRQTVWRVTWISLFACVSLYHLTMITSPLSLCGYNAYLIDYQRARQHTEGYYSPGMPLLNQNLKEGAKVLCVGNAVVFAARFPTVYNTVFDKCVFEKWLAEQQTGVLPGEWKLRPVEEIRQKLREEGITHIYVNWAEILRYRDDGSYGYTDFVTPARFAQLQELGVLGPAWESHDQSAFGRWESLSDTNKADLHRWKPTLRRTVALQPENQPVQAFQRYQIFPVEGEP